MRGVSEKSAALDGENYSLRVVHPKIAIFVSPHRCGKIRACGFRERVGFFLSADKNAQLFAHAVSHLGSTLSALALASAPSLAARQLSADAR